MWSQIDSAPLSPGAELHVWGKKDQGPRWFLQRDGDDIPYVLQEPSCVFGEGLVSPPTTRLTSEHSQLISAHLAVKLIPARRSKLFTLPQLLVAMAPMSTSTRCKRSDD